MGKLFDDEDEDSGEDPAVALFGGKPERQLRYLTQETYACAVVRGVMSALSERDARRVLERIYTCLVEEQTKIGSRFGQAANKFANEAKRQVRTGHAG